MRCCVMLLVSGGCVVLVFVCLGWVGLVLLCCCLIFGCGSGIVAMWCVSVADATC